MTPENKSSKESTAEGTLKALELIIREAPENISECYNSQQRGKYTKEPWLTSICGGTNKPAVYAESGTLKIADIYGYLYQDEANAARIVACVNFCAGVSNEDLQIFESLKWQIRNTADELHKLRSELQALKAEKEKVATEWISVADRLPKKFGRYLVCSSRGIVTTCHYHPTHSLFEGDVSHWRELPEPPPELRAIINK